MQYDDFLIIIQDDLKPYLPENMQDAEIQISNLNKEMGEPYQGISIRQPDQKQRIMMDLRTYYQLLEKGVSYKAILKEIAEQIKEGKERSEVALGAENYENIKDKLVIEVTGKEKYAEVLSEIPHTDIEDMVIIYRVVFSEDEHGRMSGLVNNDMLQRYGITVQQLHEDAIKATQASQPLQIQSITKVLNELSGGIAGDLGGIPEFIYVATNRAANRGASVLAYPDFMETAAKQMQGNFFLIPSSIHEVLLVRETGSEDYREIEDMIKEINETLVSPNERLTNHAYHYDSSEKKFELAEKYEQRKLKKILAQETQKTVNAFSQKNPTSMNPKMI